MDSDVSAANEEENYDWFREGHSLGSKLAFPVLEAWRILEEGDETGPQFDLRLDEHRRIFSDLISRVDPDAVAEDPEAPPGMISVELSFLAVCNSLLKLAMAWAEANEAVGFHPDREAARLILLRGWSDHVRDGRDNPEQFEADVGRLSRIVWAYKHRLIAASVLGEHLHDPENPPPDQPGMKSAFAIAAALSRSTRSHSGDVGAAAMEKWLKRFRHVRAGSVSRIDRLWLRLNETTVQLEFVDDPIKTALDQLPKTRGRPRGSAN
ncbi:hypothetical protein [Sphingopyxis sp.]|uniref:hypothetical protein n=1 Tax=Sphingopyxis sp. TaxID=1908224 RepID=UPI001DC8D71A|nr:hypothetical protein [Sphingopyxis sp.]MBW8296183.1 hypothetical protein [Sphingopyxis sp.]